MKLGRAPAQPRHPRGQRRVGIGQQFLVQLLAGTQAGEFDRDLVGCVAGQADQVARQVDDLHRLAHVQHQHLPAFADGRGLQHQARGFGDGHEVANDVRVRDGHRAAPGDLFLELGDHAAAAAQHVAKAHRHQACARVLGRQAAEHHLGGAFGGTHHIGRVDRLVGADQHEAFGAASAAASAAW
jgi:hypothetical protein